MLFHNNMHRCLANEKHSSDRKKHTLTDAISFRPLSASNNGISIIVRQFYKEACWGLKTIPKNYSSVFHPVSTPSPIQPLDAVRA